MDDYNELVEFYYVKEELQYISIWTDIIGESWWMDYRKIIAE